MKLKNKLLPIVALSGIATVITPITLSSCGTKNQKFDFIINNYDSIERTLSSNVKDMQSGTNYTFSADFSKYTDIASFPPTHLFISDGEGATVKDENIIIKFNGEPWQKDINYEIVEMGIGTGFWGIHFLNSPSFTTQTTFTGSFVSDKDIAEGLMVFNRINSVNI